MGFLIASGLFYGLFLLMAARFLLVSFRSAWQWLRKSPAAFGKRLLVLLPLLVLSLALSGRLLAGLSFPAQEADLQEVTARVESVQQYVTTLPARGGSNIVKRYRIYLEGFDGFLYVPEAYRFDPDAFLDWAGQAEASFRYARTGDRFPVYEIRRDDDTVFLAYPWAYERQLGAFLQSLLIGLAFLLCTLGASFKLTVYLCPPERAKRWKRAALTAFAAVLLVALFAAGGNVLQPEIVEFPADGFSLLTAELEEGISVALPRGWELGALGDDGMQWYKAADSVSTCFRLAWYVGEPDRDGWYYDFLADYRASLLDDFIQEPRGAFFESYSPSGRRVEGSNFLVSEGWGTSVNGRKNHLLLVFLPSKACAMVIQSSSAKLSWDELETYAAEWIWPLLQGLSI